MRRTLSACLLVLAGLAGAQETRVVVVPVGPLEDAPPDAAERLTTLVEEELRSRVHQLRVTQRPRTRSKAERAETPEGVTRGLQSLAEGERHLSELRLPEAAQALQRGIALLLSHPEAEAISQVPKAFLSLAVVHFRSRDTQAAQQALSAAVELDPALELPEGPYPPAFKRELEAARGRLARMPKGQIDVSAPRGARLFVNGKPRGTAPTSVKGLVRRTHYLRVELPDGEVYGAAVSLKGRKAQVRLGPKPSAGPKLPELPPMTAVLDQELASHLQKFAQAAFASHALVSVIYPLGDGRLGLAAALYSASSNGFVLLAPSSVDGAMREGRARAFQIAEQLVSRVQDFNPVLQLPYALHASARTPEPGTSTPPPSAHLLPKADEPGRPDPRQSLPRQKVGTEPQVSQGKGVSPWVWVAIGGGVALVAGGVAGGILYANRPVTGTVSVRW